MWLCWRIWRGEGGKKLNGRKRRQTRRKLFWEELTRRGRFRSDEDWIPFLRTYCSPSWRCRRENRVNLLWCSRQRHGHGCLRTYRSQKLGLILNGESQRRTCATRKKKNSGMLHGIWQSGSRLGRPRHSKGSSIQGRRRRDNRWRAEKSLEKNSAGGWYKGEVKTR